MAVDTIDHGLIHSSTSCLVEIFSDVAAPLACVRATAWLFEVLSRNSLVTFDARRSENVEVELFRRVGKGFSTISADLSLSEYNVKFRKVKVVVIPVLGSIARETLQSLHGKGVSNLSPSQLQIETASGFECLRQDVITFEGNG
jgi:hypothetical protein